METAYIYHVVPRAQFESTCDAGQYLPASLAHEGFVHCSHRELVSAIARDYFADAGPLCVLQIPVSSVAEVLRWEAPAPISGGGTEHLQNQTLFPHIYAPIALEAIEIASLGPAPDFALGRFKRHYFRWPGETVVRLPYTTHTEQLNLAQHVDHARFLEIFLMGRFAWLAEQGITLETLMNNQLGFNVAELHITYLHELFAPEQLEIETRVVPSDSRALMFEQQLWRDDTCIATLECRCVFFSMAEQKVVDWRRFRA